METGLTPNFAVATYFGDGMTISHTNRIIQIGYDYIVALSKQRHLEQALKAELERQGLSGREQEILHQIAEGFALEWEER